MCVHVGIRCSVYLHAGQPDAEFIFFYFEGHHLETNITGKCGTGIPAVSCSGFRYDIFFFIERGPGLLVGAYLNREMLRESVWLKGSGNKNKFVDVERVSKINFDYLLFRHRFETRFPVRFGIAVEELVDVMVGIGGTARND